jgi:hypothetical protein
VNRHDFAIESDVDESGGFTVVPAAFGALVSLKVIPGYVQVTRGEEGMVLKRSGKNAGRTWLKPNG